jgi:hypothetical protein
MEVIVVANTKPISDLRNYNEVLRGIDVGNPVFLTENGRGRYAILDMREYEKTAATLKLLAELSKGEESGKEQGWLEADESERDQAENALFARIAEAEMRVQSGESYLSADELKAKLGI